jgi:Family of unknown function (DUF6491)
MRITSFAMAIFMVCIAAGCAAKAEKKAPPLTVDEILANSLTESDYGKAERCLQLSAYQKIRVLDKRHLLFEGRGDNVWLNKLRIDCPGLRKNAVLQLEVRNTSVCNLDSVTSIEVRRFYVDKLSATCSLGPFIQIPREQAEFLKKEIRGK